VSAGTLLQFQRALEAVYGLEAGHQVEDFLVDAVTLEKLGRRPRAEEELLVLEEGGELELGLYISDQVMDALSAVEAGAAQGLLEGRLSPFATAAEGVSHFLYLTFQALRDRAVSLLELEVQAELDKFVTALLHLWKHGERGRCPVLRERLFDRVGYRDDLGEEEGGRYRHANRLARTYAASLEERFVLPGRLEGLLRELRRTYRLSADAKFCLLARAS